MASPKNCPRECELLADRMMLTLGGSSAILAYNLAALLRRVVFQSRIGDDDFGRDRITPLPPNGEDVSRLRRTHSAVKTGITVILQRQR